MLDMNHNVHIVQLSDFHLYADSTQTLLGLNTYESFCAAVQTALAKVPQAHAMIASGDLVHDGKKITYDRLSHMLGLFNYPVYVCPGNHDTPRMFNHIYANSHNIRREKAFTVKRWQFIILNSQIPGEVSGHLPKKELAFLESRLEEFAKYYSVIFFHHHPVKIGSAWLDPLGIDNADELFAIVDRFPNVRAIVFGHIHQEFEGFRNRVQLLATPSTCIQFKPKCKNFALDIIPPGFRHLVFDEYGHISSKVYRATHYKGYKDANAKSKGYK